ncbi:hypothetical protein A2U01_0111481, partial [Trifolium medium]|nr:hypothetical protein [Trifolium medium]
EGVLFTVWVVEEKGRERVGVGIDDGVEDFESRVVPSEAFGEVEEGYRVDVAISGEDDVSEAEVEVDVTTQ